MLNNKALYANIVKHKVNLSKGGDTKPKELRPRYLVKLAGCRLFCVYVHTGVNNAIHYTVDGS